MGHSTYSDDFYRARTSLRAATNTPTFKHTADVRSGKTEAKAFKKLDPKGMKVREARDSEAHPVALPIFIALDETGSMARNPIIIQAALPKLMALLIKKGYAEHPAILISAVGDAKGDTVPLQVGQFESGIEIDDDLTNLYLEGGGGPGQRESYELAMYVAARHTVVLPSGKAHGFSQFGAGTFAGARTHYSQFCLFDPVALLGEIEALKKIGVDSAGKLEVDVRCPVVTPYHMLASRIVENRRGTSRHGSCGMGVGSTMQDLIDNPGHIIFYDDVYSSSREALAERLEAARQLKIRQLELSDSEKARYKDSPLLDCQTVDEFAAVFLKTVTYATPVKGLPLVDGTAVFEGAQGVLLDQRYGFAPHTTWSNTTATNAWELLLSGGNRITGPVSVLGVHRCYSTRHGPGPFVGEDPAFAGKIPPDPHNGTHEFQGEFRRGTLDLVALRYALEVCSATGWPISELALTCWDHVRNLHKVPVVTGYYGIDGSGHDQLVQRLPVDREPNHDSQQILSWALQRAGRVTKDYHPNELLGIVEGEYNRRVSLISDGPTWLDKQENPRP